MPLRSVLCLCFLLLSLLSLPVRAQPTYISTDSNAQYGVYQYGNSLFAEVEWVYSTALGQWTFTAPQFSIQVTSFTSFSNYQNGIVHSQATNTYSAASGNWIYGGQGPGQGRCYAYLYLGTLPQGYYNQVHIQPSVGWSLYQGPVQGYTYGTWQSDPVTLNVDLLHPGDSP